MISRILACYPGPLHHVAARAGIPERRLRHWIALDAGQTPALRCAPPTAADAAAVRAAVAHLLAECAAQLAALD